MPVFTDLDRRILEPPFELAEYQRRLPEAAKVASMMPLVHVDNRFEAILATPPYEIPTAEGPSSQQAEDLLGYRRSVYFYAGRACPRFGNVALAFSPKCEEGQSGSVTPFDSGGLVHPRKYIKIRLVPDDENPARIEYGKKSTLELSEWREVLSRVLAAYFDRDIDYWTGYPARLDPENLYDRWNSYQAWSFEVRFYEPQPVLKRVAWTADESTMNLLRRMLNEQPVTIPGDPPTILDQVFAVPALDPAGAPTFCATMEQWVIAEVGL